MKKSARTIRKEALLKKQRIRTTVFAVLVIGVLGLTGYYLKSAFFRSAPEPIAGNVIDVEASMSGFDKKKIRVKVGQPVTIRLTSPDTSAHTDGGGKHQWAAAGRSGFCRKKEGYPFGEQGSICMLACPGAVWNRRSCGRCSKTMNNILIS